MENVGLYLVVLVATLPCMTTAASPTGMDFIRASCKTTLHASLCVRCLSSYASSIKLGSDADHLLAKAAISVSLNNTKSASVFITKLGRVSGIKPREYQAVKDCMSIMSNSVSSLSQSVQELEQMARTTGQDFEWYMSNTETWVGSALTNQNICARGFDDSYMNGHVKDAVTRRMIYVSQVTSNALALLNRFAIRHRKGRIHKP